MLRSSEHIDDVLDGFVSAVIRSFEAAVGPVLGIGAMVETAGGAARNSRL